MPLLYSNAELLELMKQFYILTGIRIILFDDEYSEILAYPADKSSFCTCMREIPEFDNLCRKSDRESFMKCRKLNSFTVYKCHAGLIEAIAPISENNVVIGYIMFGQITDNKNKDDFLKEITEYAAGYTDKDITEEAKKIKYKKPKQVAAASKILEACTSYIMLKEMIKPSKKRLINNIDEFVEAHINEQIKINRLCSELHISRTRLYEATAKYTGGGIAGYIQKKKMAKAKKLLTDSELSISDIASATGFDDYNYFLKVFKKHYGISPKKLRKTSEN